eukprot:TRINITY_DN30335_c0_g2_i1.p1 TRINITY_DN30335_c0_g2~~TRINITY_DN30335_c0_g2_i1.p1  ORF type:complete len:656 (-),score=86.43 TRINITY_DN30335_c0_g2_i1:66-1856(-)
MMGDASGREAVKPLGCTESARSSSCSMVRASPPCTPWTGSRPFLGDGASGDAARLRGIYDNLLGLAHAGVCTGSLSHAELAEGLRHVGFVAASSSELSVFVHTVERSRLGRAPRFESFLDEVRRASERASAASSSSDVTATFPFDGKAQAVNDVPASTKNDFAKSDPPRQSGSAGKTDSSCVAPFGQLLSRRCSANSQGSSTKLEKRCTKIESDSSGSESAPSSTVYEVVEAKSPRRKQSFSFADGVVAAAAAAEAVAASEAGTAKSAVAVAQALAGVQEAAAGTTPASCDVLESPRTSPELVAANGQSLCDLLTHALAQLPRLRDPANKDCDEGPRTKLEQALTAAFQAGTKLESRLADAEGAIAKGRENAREGWQELRELAASIESHEAAIATARDELSRTREELASVVASREALSASCQAARAEAAGVRDELRQAHNDLDVIGAELQKARAEVERAVAELYDNRTRLERTCDDLTQLRAEHAATVTSLEQANQASLASRAIRDWLLHKRPDELLSTAFRAFQVFVGQGKEEQLRKRRTQKVAAAYGVLSLRRRLRNARVCGASAVEAPGYDESQANGQAQSRVIAESYTCPAY